MELTQERGLRVLGQVNAVLTDSHFVYSSGKHGSAYVDKDRIYAEPAAADECCSLMSEIVFDLKPDVLIGPAHGAIGFALLVGVHLGGGVKAGYAEKTSDGFKLRASFAKLVKGRRVVVIEDILNTGGSAIEVVEAVRAVGGEVVGVVAICNRGGVTAEQVGNVPFVGAVVDVTMDAWEEDDMPDWLRQVPVNTDVGHGKAYVTAHT